MIGATQRSGGELSIGEVARRSGLAVSALRFYEANGLISSTRTEGGQRRYRRDVLRRLAVIQAAQQVGFPLAEIAGMLAELPADRPVSPSEWQRLALSWRPQLDERIRTLEQLRDQLDSCVGCGCLSMERCALANPADRASALGPGPRFWLRGRRTGSAR
ncbi:MAG: redox-sensitive transcriptional activator SoxR [Actinomycetota bacterium]|nr:redox-sensitive transcriptional activator SoxR [Actinomycetota bacterium]MDP9020774.1 redox-sensitive transcriptional activator SoxR [Actinomycetota bacterium]